jgi:hypothetical protein
VIGSVLSWRSSATLVVFDGLLGAGDEARARRVVYHGCSGGSETQAAPTGEAFGTEDDELGLIKVEVLEDGVSWLPVGPFHVWGDSRGLQRGDGS